MTLAAESERVELKRHDKNPHPVVEPVQVLAPARVPADGVRRREREVLEDPMHGRRLAAARNRASWRGKGA